MALTEQKVDAIARILLSQDVHEIAQAREELRWLMDCPPELRKRNVTAQIHKLLNEVGVPTHLNGHAYLVDAIHAVIDDPQALINVGNAGGLWQRIGENHGGKSIKAVERGLRSGIEAAWNHGNHEFQAQHFTAISPATMVPTVLNFISRAANIVQLRMEQQ